MSASKENDRGMGRKELERSGAIRRSRPTTVQATSDVSSPAAAARHTDEILDASRINTWRGAPSFTWSNRLYRAAFALVWRLACRWTPPPWRGWRRQVLRAFGAKMAQSANVYPSAVIWSPRNLELGEHACIGPRVTVYSMALITLEPYALVSQGAHLCAGTHNIEDANFQLQARPIRIGARAWVAAEAFVGPGVEIGRGAVLGARACATKNLEPWTVYVGNPARAIKPRRVRFPDCPE